MTKLRIGQGYDSHRLEEGRRLILGGVEIDYELGLAGHSDADALLHAIIDALLGAAALGDIGGLFPDTDDKHKGADSMELLKTAYAKVLAVGFSAVNVDSTVICERPKLKPYIERMRKNIAAALGLDTADISVKAKTNEKLDAVGAGKGIACHSVVLLEKG